MITKNITKILFGVYYEDSGITCLIQFIPEKNPHGLIIYYRAIKTRSTHSSYHFCSVLKIVIGSVRHALLFCHVLCYFFPLIKTHITPRYRRFGSPEFVSFTCHPLPFMNSLFNCPAFIFCTSEKVLQFLLLFGITATASLVGPTHSNHNRRKLASLSTKRLKWSKRMESSVVKSGEVGSYLKAWGYRN